MCGDTCARGIHSCAVRRRAQGGDALWRREERTALAFESGRLKSATTTEEAGVNLRVVKDGRVGVAGTTAADTATDGLLDRALASAALGEALNLTFPPPSPLPHVPTVQDVVHLPEEVEYLGSHQAVGV